ncbi:hypothetical protein AVEN_66987-1 [Araneus ventricosus]|uniref:Uncharacterized protein n=1 Tax=Araneus ventricosus TaxID=182803 RepID=A0A4Y2T007_ARAVE|nr:hypothetical protein AVEN_66987-1 [Araneus ventricosus]
MADPVDNSKIITPYLPSLSHIATVSAASQLFNGFDFETLKMVFTEIEHGNSTARNEGSEENGDGNYKRAKEYLLFLPRYLRKRVMGAAQNMQYAVLDWRERLDIFDSRIGDCTFYWRSDGIIDKTKTVERVVLNKNIDIRERFNLACLYCLVDSMRTLWAEAEEDAEGADLEIYEIFPWTQFWIRWLWGGSHIPWDQAALECDEFHLFENPFQRISFIFPLLLPEERKHVLLCLRNADFDDLLFCLYAATKEEEEQILRRNTEEVLMIYLYTWPLQSLFLETAEKVWNYINPDSFRSVLLAILLLRQRKEIDFIYYEIFEGFWNRSPDNFRTHAREFCGPEIDLCFNEIKEKRNTNEQAQSHRKV